ncbi:uncharacterized protein VTP21DRAFT_9975 [Calcarisporiella thermophila]|uniref:uncharacterized protein n=1 Tax=Calcarisporiella thermophila TaxID=911321 RepID=UPI0037448EC1
MSPPSLSPVCLTPPPPKRSIPLSPPHPSIKEPSDKVDERDLKTPDCWVKRHPDMVRLTGKHPFNAEAPLSKLMAAGFFTPTPLHYVRNHGAVPKLAWHQHTLEITGLVDKPIIFSMDEIEQMPSVTLPVTMVCAGNRRKEQNMVKQTIGFNWGAAAVSTAVWKGVPLRYVLNLCGVQSSARWVCFEGADKLPKGYYGTSISVERAMGEYNDVLLAYEMNGERLHPDHGFPLRTILPGCIGGRTVKWLKKITLTIDESDNYYHIYDNRVLPSTYDAERANKENAWSNPDFVINELNTNSTITSPAHDEVLPLTPGKLDSNYTVGGYAYSGGGKKVTRVEASLDDGKTWIDGTVYHPEEKLSPVAGRRYWCWAFWSADIPVRKLLQCKEIVCRAWDSHHNTQPGKLTWNVMGMMNNSWFRVKVSLSEFSVKGQPQFGLRFQHPTVPGNQSGGWMPPPEQPIPEKKEAPMATPDRISEGGRTFSKEEIAKHDKEDDVWIIIEGKVYDCTRFLEEHPGGAESIMLNAGGDATEEFNAIHSSKAHDMLKDYYIGEVKESGSRPVPSEDLPKANGKVDTVPVTTVFLSQREWKTMKLKEKQILSHDTRLFRFEFPDSSMPLGLPTGKHVLLKSRGTRETLIRSYTPVSKEDALGHVDFVIKVYRPLLPHFPEGGKFSQWLDAMQPGDEIDIKGPTGSFLYEGRGRWAHGKQSGQAKRIGMICGGTGITPIFQVLRAVAEAIKHGDTTEVNVIYANRTEDDILLYQELSAYEAAHPSQIKIWYTLNNPPAGWAYSEGYVNETMIREHIFPDCHDHSDTILLLCGPPPMLQLACLPNIEKVFGDIRTFIF